MIPSATISDAAISHATVSGATIPDRAISHATISYVDATPGSQAGLSHPHTDIRASRRFSLVWALVIGLLGSSAAHAVPTGPDAIQRPSFLGSALTHLPLAKTQALSINLHFVCSGKAIRRRVFFARPTITIPGIVRYHLKPRPQKAASDNIESVEIHTEYLAACRVIREHFDIALAPATRLRVLNRRLKFTRPTPRGVHVGRLTPKRVLLLYRGASRGLDATSQGLFVSRRRLTFELDDERNRPLRVFTKCYASPKFRGQRKRIADTRPVTRRGQTRRFSLRVTFAPGPLFEIVRHRFRQGKRAAIVFTDHADQSRTATLEALLFGRTGAVKAGDVGSKFPGLANRGLGFTKTVFAAPFRGYAPQLSSTPYRAVLSATDPSRIRIGLHSLTGGPDSRRSARALLKTFGNWLGSMKRNASHRTWVDHQPDTNCEAITNRGTYPGEYAMLDLLEASGFRQLWNAVDLRSLGGDLNLLDPKRPHKRTAVLYRHPLVRGKHGRRFELFASMNTFAGSARFRRIYARTKLRALSDAFGLHIAHVYLDTFRRRGRLRRRTLLRRSRRKRTSGGPCLRDRSPSGPRVQNDGRSIAAR